MLYPLAPPWQCRHKCPSLPDTADTFTISYVRLDRVSRINCRGMSWGLALGGQQLILDTVGQGLPAGLHDVLGDADRPHLSLWSPDSIKTRTFDSVPRLAERTRTL